MDCSFVLKKNPTKHIKNFFLVLSFNILVAKMIIFHIQYKWKLWVFHRRISIEQLWNSICLQVPLINVNNLNIFYCVWLNVITALGDDEGFGSFLLLYSESE